MLLCHARHDEWRRYLIHASLVMALLPRRAMIGAALRCRGAGTHALFSPRRNMPTFVCQRHAAHDTRHARHCLRHYDTPQLERSSIRGAAIDYCFFRAMLSSPLMFSLLLLFIDFFPTLFRCCHDDAAITLSLIFAARCRYERAMLLMISFASYATLMR